jgi:hypothetical protein
MPRVGLAERTLKLLRAAVVDEETVARRRLPRVGVTGVTAEALTNGLTYHRCAGSDVAACG